jgi:NADH-quinone oxidoreductase subunit H
MSFSLDILDKYIAYFNDVYEYSTTVYQCTTTFPFVIFYLIPYWIFEYINDDLTPFTFKYSMITVLFHIILTLMAIAFVTLLERKFMGSIQRRKGPNIVGYFGLLQPFADGLKLFLKEFISIKDSDYYIFTLCPLLTFFFSMKLWQILPLNELDLTFLSSHGVFLLLIFLSFGAYGIIYAGWSSNSKYAFLGGLRSTAQMISYEVCLSFIFLSVVTLSRSLDFNECYRMQSDVPFIFPLLPGWILFIICALAETNRAPFDLPEAEAELVAGYNVEYSSMPFALFFLAEYSNLLVMSILGYILFFVNFGTFLSFEFEYHNIIYVVKFKEEIISPIKITLHFILFIQIRALLPRYRYDQLMSIGWKHLLPISFIHLLLTNAIVMHIEKYASICY